ncbi:nucleotide exchange factor GrpE [Nocardia beijingensis]|uniref:nucleotide exchange factor GrpE n=1 Tax=Nocardia beijingensis TaxID=95162 RepID=UPI0018962B40|nr:nucleotide exchange factor GrpE [Nocardia beijingensis]MBF6467159.1 nucleotide exchange factor GrpE [Nocardia beijingensis]
MTAAPGADDPSTALAGEIAQLRDLFQRRLLEDKAKNRALDTLHDQLALARGAMAEQLLAPLMRELLRLVDRVTALNGADDAVLDSIVDELHELLERRGVRRVPAMADFDPDIHEAVAVAEAPGRSPGSVLRVVRYGYLMGERLLRPEQVVVAGRPARSAPVETDSTVERFE